jgi:hypothetical protein
MIFQGYCTYRVSRQQGPHQRASCKLDAIEPLELEVIFGLLTYRMRHRRVLQFLLPSPRRDRILLKIEVAADTAEAMPMTSTHSAQQVCCDNLISVSVILTVITLTSAVTYRREGRILST